MKKTENDILLEDLIVYIKKNTSGLSHIQISNLLYAITNAIDRTISADGFTKIQSLDESSEQILCNGIKFTRLKNAIDEKRKEKRMGWGTSDTAESNRRGSKYS
jgi:hypothetical protein